MTTITATNAKLKVRLDLAGQSAELKALEEQMARVQEGLRREGDRARQDSREDERRASDANRDAQRGAPTLGAIRFNPLNPLDTVLSVIGALPQVGPTIEKSLRVGMNLSEGGLPLVSGFAKQLLRSKGLGGETQEAVIDSMLVAMQKMSADVAELRAKNDAIAPAYEAMKTFVKAQTLAGGTPSGKEIGEFGVAMWKIISSKAELDRKVRRIGLEAVGEGAERLFEGMFQ